MKRYSAVKQFFLIPISIILSLITTVQAQPLEWTAYNFPNSYFLGIHEKDNKYIGAVSNGARSSVDTNSFYQLSLYDIVFGDLDNPELALTETITIPYTDNYATIEQAYIEETGVWLIVQSAVIPDDKQRFRILLSDENFNIITEQTIDTTGRPGPFYIDSYEGHTYILGSIIGQPHKLLFLQYSHSEPYLLKHIKVKRSTPQSIFLMSSMSIDERSGDMLVFYYGGIAKLDTNLQTNLVLYYEDINTSFHGTVLGTENNYFSHSLTDQEIIPEFQYLVFQKYDTLFNIITSDTLGIRDNAVKNYYPFLTNSLVHRNKVFLMGGHIEEGTSPAYFLTSIKKFYLAKYDEEMNQIWYKEYGGDRVYNMLGLILLDDGSSCAYGSIADIESGLWYAYILRLDTNGDIITSYTIPEIPTFNVQAINPGNNQLQILNQENISAQIILYNLDGKEVLKEILNTGWNEFAVGMLPNGIYPYIILDDGVLKTSGQWVKGL